MQKIVKCSKRAGLENMWSNEAIQAQKSLNKAISGAPYVSMPMNTFR